MSAKTVNGLMFILAGITPPVVYLGLGPDGSGILDMARTEQLFAYLFFSLPIAFMMTRKVQTNNFLDAGLLILVASMSMSMVADALGASSEFTKMSDTVSVTAFSSIMLGSLICGIGIFRTELFPRWLSGLFTAAAGIAFLLLATAAPADIESYIPVFLLVHLVMIILGVHTIRRSA
jgi:predicted neutral ceramidase superfamily lipid hydrolase